MAEPTIARRLQRRYLVLTCDTALIEALRGLTPQGWDMAVATDVAAVGEWHELLLYRFLLLDLDETDAYEPLDVIRTLRREYQINIPVFCVGGDDDIREEMRLSRADRFFDREELLALLPKIFAQYP